MCAAGFLTGFFTTTVLATGAGIGIVDDQVDKHSARVDGDAGPDFQRVG
jgi:hypothetical protein